MSNIQSAFEQGKSLVAFFVCGDPDLETTAAAIREAVKNGVDMVELGIPFSDPFVEGDVIQRAYQRARHGGITTDRVFDFVGELRRELTVPLIFMTYVNVIFSYGIERFLSRCRAVGIDGVILHDLPYEEREEFAPICKTYGVDLISAIAPTSEERIAMIAKEADGFLRIVANVCGTDEREKDLASVLRVVRENTALPCVVDCDATIPEQIRETVALADGTVVTFAFIHMIEQYGVDAVPYVGEYAARIKSTMK